MVENERLRLFANALDRVSTTCFTVGVATPLAGYVYNVGNFGGALSPWQLALGLLGESSLELPYIIWRDVFSEVCDERC